ncbi:MAG TPA: tRNA dihydrouridine(20/20a) synthase DusA [Alphaproteobacteria bacterium]|nr:tRNA dihydrouridine(20/20a) synthase DusA [Alphaproteobacteria bacterium]
MQEKILAVAPMMDWTDRHCRFFLRQLAPHAVLYTEMVTTGAILHGDRQRFLGFDPAERPLVLQLGGADPAALARCAALGAAWGYDAINLNCGCPSDRVQSGRFGACLMAEPETVAACIAAMADAVVAPITVKCRIGIEPSPDPARDDYDLLAAFVAKVSAAGAGTIALHARNAVLSGLSPKENREIPPLRHALGYRLKQDFPHLTILLNGGIETVEQVQAHLPHVDGVMLGRVAYHDPWRLTEIEAALFATPLPDRHAVAAAMVPYAEARMREGTPLKSIARHMLGLFQGLPGARRWRRILSEEAHRPDATPDLLLRAAEAVPRAAALVAAAE